MERGEDQTVGNPMYRRITNQQRATICEMFVCNPDEPMASISRITGVSLTNVSEILTDYFPKKPIDGIVLTLKSKV